MSVVSEVAAVMLANASKAGWCLLSRTEIATEINRSPKSVSNAIAYMRQLGAIETSGHGVGTIYKVLFTIPIKRECKPSVWPEHRVEKLLQLRSIGLSNSECAEQMRTSRSAIIAKLKRLKQHDGMDGGR